MNKKMTMDEREEVKRMIKNHSPSHWREDHVMDMLQLVFGDLKATEDALDQAETEILYLEKSNHLLEEDYQSMVLDSKYGNSKKLYE